jgi:hypothetical protein
MVFFLAQNSSGYTVQNDGKHLVSTLEAEIVGVLADSHAAT